MKPRRGLDPFVLVVLALCAFYAGNRLSPSSYGQVLRDLKTPVDGVVFGEPRPIRSDEFAIWTPLVQIAVDQNFENRPVEKLTDQSLRTLMPLPVRDWGLLFKPTFWPFFVAPPDLAYSAFFALNFALFLIGFYALFLCFGQSRPVAVLATLTLFSSSFVMAWWTSFGPHLAITPLLLLALALKLNPVVRFLLVAYLTALALLGATFYPPLLVSLILAGLCGIKVFRPDTLDRRTLIPAAFGVVVGAAIAAFYLRAPLAAMLTTVNHGARRLDGGSVPLVDWLGLFFPFVPTRGHFALEGANFCEASSAGSWLLILLVCFGTWQKGIDRAALARRASWLLAPFAAISTWMLLPLPAWLGQIFLWHKMPASRLLFPAGLLLLFLALLLLPALRLRFTVGRFFVLATIVIAAWWPSRYIAGEFFDPGAPVASFLNLERYWRSNADLYLLAALPLLIAVAALIQRFRPELASTAWIVLAAAAISNALGFADYNPVQSTGPIFARPSSERIEELRAQQAAHPQDLLVIGDRELQGLILKGYGFKAVNAAWVVPKPEVYRPFFPELPEQEFQQAFNRYGLIQVADLPDGRPQVVGGDLTMVPAAAFLPAP